MTQTITIDRDSITAILTSEEIEALGYGACRQVANAMQDVADVMGIDVRVDFENVSGKRRDEDEETWETLAISYGSKIRSNLTARGVLPSRA